MGTQPGVTWSEGVEVSLIITDLSRLRAKIKGDLLRGNKIDYQTGIANAESLKCKLQVIRIGGVSQNFGTKWLLSNWDTRRVGGKGDL